MKNQSQNRSADQTQVLVYWRRPVELDSRRPLPAPPERNTFYRARQTAKGAVDSVVSPFLTITTNRGQTAAKSAIH